MRETSILIVTTFILVTILSTGTLQVSAKKYTNHENIVTGELAANFLKDIDLLEGNEKGDLMLNRPLKRQDMIVALSRLKGQEKEAETYPTDNMTFKDVPNDNYYKHIIAWAQGKGITTGYNSQKFGFDDNVTGWQAKAFLVKVLGYTYIPDEKINENAEKLGITTFADIENKKPIPRKDLALLMYNTIYAKGTDNKVLGRKLGVIGPAFAENLPTGNTIGNIINGGLFAMQGDWIYYNCMSDDYKLYKIKTDGTNKTKICDDKKNKYINVVDEWVYYQNGSNGELYKIRTDGTDKQLLDEKKAENIFVRGEWIYYVSGEERKFAKIRTDGTNKTIISNYSVEYACVIGDRVYFTTFDDEKRIYSITINGTYLDRITEDSAEYVNVSNGWIYYTNLSDNNKPYKIRISGRDKTKLSDDPCRNLYVQENGVLYLNGNDEFKPYVMNSEGKEKKELVDLKNQPFINKIGNIFIYNIKQPIEKDIEYFNEHDLEIK